MHPLLRAWSIACVCLGGACFKDLPTVPGDSSETTAATSSPTTGADSSTAGAEVTSAAEMTTDGDMLSSGPATPDVEGLFACVPALCEPWLLPDCDGACGVADAAGQCLLGSMRDRVSGRGEVRVCGDECVRTAIAVRGGGSDDIKRQTATEVGEGLAGYTDARRCVLREPEFFAGCLGGLTAACVDPMQWFVSCEAIEQACDP